MLEDVGFGDEAGAVLQNVKCVAALAGGIEVIAQLSVDAVGHLVGAGDEIRIAVVVDLVVGQMLHDVAQGIARGVPAVALLIVDASQVGWRFAASRRVATRGIVGGRIDGCLVTIDDEHEVRGGCTSIQDDAYAHRADVAELQLFMTRGALALRNHVARNVGSVGDVQVEVGAAVGVEGEGDVEIGAVETIPNGLRPDAAADALSAHDLWGVVKTIAGLVWRRRRRRRRWRRRQRGRGGPVGGHVGGHVGRAIRIIAGWPGIADCWITDTTA